jgi:predicted nucleotidyltransferase
MVRLTLGARIEQAGRALVDAASSPARVILFGSHARGDADDGSDFDFLDAALAERRAKVPGTMVHRALLEGRVVAES